MKRIILSLAAFTICCLQAVCQDKVIIHSTDDFKRDIPFFEAYLEGISSFEADIALEGKTIMIADDSGRNLESTYMEPVSRLFRDNGGRIRKGTESRIQMVFDIKDTDGEKTLKALEKMLSKYPGAFDLMQNEYAVHVLVTGNIPSPEKFSEYAACISFEGKPGADYTEEQLNAWATGTVDLEKWDASFQEHDTLIAVEGSRIIGFADMDSNGYLDRLYVHKDLRKCCFFLEF